MSRHVTFAPPPGARAYFLPTARGEFAVIDSPVADGVEPQGVALLLPGFTGSKEDFNLVHGPLAARGYRTVAVDGRGQFESDGPVDDEFAYAQGELARDVLAQAEAVGTPLHLVGHSLGGQIARAAVLLAASPSPLPLGPTSSTSARPSLAPTPSALSPSSPDPAWSPSLPAPSPPFPFRSLTLIASGPAEISGPQQQRVKLLRDALDVMSMEEVWEAIQAMGPPEEVGGPARGPGGPEQLRRRWLGTKPSQLRATGHQLCTEPDRVAELAAVPLPYHVVSGVRDETWPVPLLDDMARRLRARRTVIPGAEHSPNADQPLPTALALAGFWDSLEKNN